MTKHWGILATFALAACSGHSIPSAGPVSAELHAAPAFAPVRTTKIDPIAASMEFVGTQGRALGLDGHAAFTALRSDVGQDGLSHVRLQQTYDGVPVWGSDVVVHHDGESVVGVDGTLLGGMTEPRPRALARRHHGDDGGQERLYEVGEEPVGRGHAPRVDRAPRHADGERQRPPRRGTSSSPPTARPGRPASGTTSSTRTTARSSTTSTTCRRRSSRPAGPAATRASSAPGT